MDYPNEPRLHDFLRILLKILRISLPIFLETSHFRYTIDATFSKKSIYYETLDLAPLTFPHRGVKKNKKCVKTFDFLYGKQQEVGKFQSSGEDSGSGQRFVKRESRFHATNTFTGKLRSRRCSIRRLPPIFPPGRNKRFDLCLRRSLRDADDLWIVARSFHLASFRVTSRLVVHRHCASFPPLVNPWIHNNLKIIITFSRSSMEKLVEKSRGYMFCLFISGHERQGADTKVNTNGRKIITYTNKLGV